MSSYAALQRPADQVLDLVKKLIGERCEVAHAPTPCQISR